MKDKPVAVVASTVPVTLYAFHQELLRQVGEAGHDVLVVSSPGEHLDRLAALGHRTVAIPMVRELSPLADAAALREWIALLRRERPSLVITATPKASLLGQLAARATGVGDRLYYVGGLRFEGDRGWRRALLKATERLTGACATDVVVNSPSLEALSRQTKVFPSRKLRATVPASSHGVDSEHFAPAPADEELRTSLGLDLGVPTLVFIGRLTRDKGVDALTGALTTLQAHGIPVQLVVVGSLEEGDSTARADDLRATGTPVVFTGHVDDVRPYALLADIHVLPSLREGFPNVVLEAAALGVPTITTDATGCVDSVRDGETGLVVPAGDGDALADAIERLVADPALRRRMAADARDEVVQRFQPTAIVASLLGERAP